MAEHPKSKSTGDFYRCKLSPCRSFKPAISHESCSVGTPYLIFHCDVEEELWEGDDHADDPDGHGDQDRRRPTHPRRQRADYGVVPARRKKESTLETVYKVTVYKVKSLIKKVFPCSIHHFV